MTAMNAYAERFVVSDATAAGAVRRAAAQLATQLGFNATDNGKLALVATEVAQNIFTHARTGEVFVRATGPKSIELLAIDKGPGMRNVAECMRDGFSTAGTQGMGLGMLSRMATHFDLYSRAGQGTVIHLDVHASDVPPQPRMPITYGVVCVSHPGESVIGDGFCVQASAQSWRALVVDGLGHGISANEAAAEAIRVFQANANEPSIEIIQRIHAALRKTRGAAGAILRLDAARGEAHFIGVGNVGATLLHEGKTRNMVSHNGTLGLEMRRVQEFSYPFPSDAIVVVFSDGLSSHWKVDDYPGLLQKHPSVIAGVMYRDFSRGRDDITVLCVRRSMAS